MDETTWQYVVQDFSPLFTYAGASTTIGSNQQSALNPAWSQTCPSGASQLDSNTICDISSTHTTSISGASVSLTFYGQSIQFMGNVTGGMEYDVNVDGHNFPSTPSSQQLASVSNLARGEHTINLTAKSLVSSPGPKLSFQGAVVTVGTGLTGAKVTRTIIQDSDLSVQYNGGNWSIQQYDRWGFPHLDSNTTWHQLDINKTGSYSIPFSGNAIMIHGVSWSYSLSDNRFSIDDESAVITYVNSSLANVGAGYIYTTGLTYIRANLSDGSHLLKVDNSDGVGHLGLDYVEVIQVTIGSPPGTASSSKNKTAVGKIVGPIFGVGIPFLILLVFAFLFYKRRWRRRPDLEAHASVTRFEDDSPKVSEKTSPAPEPSVVVASTTAVPSSVVVAIDTAPSTETPDQQRMRELEAELAQARENGGGANSAELQAMRRDLQQLVQLIDRPRPVNDDEPPPEYVAAHPT